MAESSTELKILIVGAGIGGLTAALALRQNGHEVTIFEASKFSYETGAAIHVAPNCNGLLRRLGIQLENYGANLCNGLAFFTAGGLLVNSADLRPAASQWQHPWLLVHRARLHAALREHALSMQGKGKPCVLHLASKVEKVDPENASVRVDGKLFQGDIVIGADGVHSACRKSLDGGRGLTPFDAGQSAFRWLVPIEQLREDPATERFIGPEGTLSIVLGGEMRLVHYPCNDNALMNCLFIHPSHMTPRSEGEWNRPGDKALMLKIAEPFAPDVKAWLARAPEDSLKLWTLLDLPVLHTWTKGRMALLGDAAHPFLPHQAQGGAQAIEDAVALAAMLPSDTPRDDIQERLELYVQVRKPRADRVQHFTRMAGQPGPTPPAVARTFNDYNFSHDEWHNSTAALRKHLWSKKAYRYRQPFGFGPAPGPRQPFGVLPASTDGYQIVRSIRFETSKTYLQTILPPGFSFASAATVVQASLVCASLKSMAWLGGGGYDLLSLHIHGVQYTKKNAEAVHGSFVPVFFENLADPITTGREELGAPKLACDIDIEKHAQATTVRLSWRGAEFGRLLFPNTSQHTTVSKAKPQPDDGLLMWRYIPAVGPPGFVDVEYPVLIPHPTKTSENPTQDITFGHNTADYQPDPSSSSKPEPSFSFDALDWARLPTLHHVTSALAGMPVYGMLESKIEKIETVPDLGNACRIE